MKSKLANNHQIKINIKTKRKETKATKFALLTSLFYLIGNMPNAITAVIFYAGLGPMQYSIIATFTNTLSLISHSSFFFIYFFTNTTFERNFINIFCVRNVDRAFLTESS